MPCFDLWCLWHRAGCWWLCLLHPNPCAVHFLWPRSDFRSECIADSFAAAPNCIHHKSISDRDARIWPHCNCGGGARNPSILRQTLDFSNKIIFLHLYNLSLALLECAWDLHNGTTLLRIITHGFLMVSQERGCNGMTSLRHHHHNNPHPHHHRHHHHDHHHHHDLGGALL